jgi:hypothetical protein
MDPALFLLLLQAALEPHRHASCRFTFHVLYSLGPFSIFFSIPARGVAVPLSAGVADKQRAWSELTGTETLTLCTVNPWC